MDSDRVRMDCRQDQGSLELSVEKTSGKRVGNACIFMIISGCLSLSLLQLHILLMLMPHIFHCWHLLQLQLFRWYWVLCQKHSVEVEILIDYIWRMCHLQLQVQLRNLNSMQILFCFSLEPTARSSRGTNSSVAVGIIWKILTQPWSSTPPGQFCSCTNLF